MKNPQDSPEDEYLVLHQEQVQGPFGADFIEAMIQAGVYPPSVKVQKPGTSSWTSISPIASSSQEAKRTARSKAKKNEVIVGKIAGAIGVLTLVWIIASVTSTNRKAPAHASPQPTSTNQKAPAHISTPPTSTSSTSRYRPPAETSIPPLSTPRSAYSTPRNLAPPDNLQIYRDTSGHSYRVSNADYYRLQGMSSALSHKETNLNHSKQEQEALYSKIESDRIYLDRTNSYAVDTFNANVRRLNAMNGPLKTLIDDYNRDVDAFNAELARVGTPIY